MLKIKIRNDLKNKLLKLLNQILSQSYVLNTEGCKFDLSI